MLGMVSCLHSYNSGGTGDQTPLEFSTEPLSLALPQLKNEAYSLEIGIGLKC